MGIEFLLIDSKATTIQAFISAHFLSCFRDELKPNTIYKLNRFTVRPSKLVNRVSPHKHGISFTNKTTFAAVHEGYYQIDSQHFRLQNLTKTSPTLSTNTQTFLVSDLEQSSLLVFFHKNSQH